MDTLIVEGGTPLCGEVELSGAKNSITKLMVASMLTADACTFHRVPHIGDSLVTQAICEALGTRFTALPPRTLEAHTPELCADQIPLSLASHNRLAIMTVAPLLHRLGRAVVPAMAGGDRIGPRPVDFHLEGYRAMGAQVEVRDQIYYFETDGLRGADIALPYPSVTTTENLLMAATLARGRTFIRNAAIEPEVMDLVMFLQKMGAIIDYNVDRTLVVEGVESLRGAIHELMPDRLVAASMGAAAVASGGDVFVRGARQADLVAFLNTLRRVGGQFEVMAEGIRFYRRGPLRAITLETNVHPGFMTDWQPPFAILLTQAEGMSVIHETVFEGRFGYVEQLQRMGADVAVYDTCLGGSRCRFATSNYQHSCVIRGPTRLHGAQCDIPDLRAGFTYLIAAILAQGTSTLTGVEHLDRGYEDLAACLQGLGARLKRSA